MQVRRAGDIMDRRFAVVPATITFAGLSGHLTPDEKSVTNFLLEDDGRITGMLTREAALSLLKRGFENDTLGENAEKGFIAVNEKMTIPRIISRIFSHEIAFVLVVTDGNNPTVRNVRGVLTKERLAEFVAEAIEPDSQQ